MNTHYIQIKVATIKNVFPQCTDVRKLSVLNYLLKTVLKNSMSKTFDTKFESLQYVRIGEKLFTPHQELIIFFTYLISIVV